MHLGWSSVCVWIAKTHRAGSFTVSSNIIYLQHLWQLFRKFGTPLLLATCARTSTSCWVWLLCLPVRAPDEGPPTFHKRSLHIKSHIKSDFLWLCDCPAAHCLVCPQIWIAHLIDIVGASAKWPELQLFFDEGGQELLKRWKYTCQTETETIEM